MCSLNSKRMSLLKPDDDIKLLEKSQNASQKAMKAGQSGKSNKFKEVNSAALLILYYIVSSLIIVWNLRFLDSSTVLLRKR
ncbi:hypothetical protein MKX03_000859 [Papaver bracteatum]|nr:hypothetical protein MKX03_000859 [Papaver bracteatum]